MSLFSFFRIFSKNDKKHWEKIYNRNSPDRLGWFQEHPEISLKLITNSKIGLDAHIVDIGGGASRLTSVLLERGYHNLSVFDISPQALDAAKMAMGEKAQKINWIEGNITSHVFDRQYDIWHDRAVFHFLTEKADREKYLQTLSRTLTENGHFIIATFTPEAPPQCSGLPVVRYTIESLQKEVGKGFELINSQEELHNTPGNTIQKFIYGHFRRIS